jgi:hypothetical protein
MMPALLTRDFRVGLEAPLYAGVFPKDKFRLVKAFERRGHAR